MCRVGFLFFFFANGGCDLFHSDIFFGGVWMGKEQSVFGLALGSGLSHGCYGGEAADSVVAQEVFFGWRSFHNWFL